MGGMETDGQGREGGARGAGPEEMDDAEFRAAMARMGPGEFAAAARARELRHWRERNRFCGRCGAPTAPHPDPAERAMVCPKCGFAAYPAICPAVIALVERDGKVLLQRNSHYRSANWSLVAGFVDPGETFEEAIRREIREEASIEVEGLRYAGSQPWPFPSAMMVAFTARYASGELRPDGTEVLESGWFAPDAFPPLPPPGSVARRLLDGFAARALRRERRNGAVSANQRSR